MHRQTPSTSRIERDVNRIVLAGFRRLVYRNTRNVLARNEGRIGAWVNAAVRCLARLEGIAEIIGNRALLHVGAVLDGGLVVSFGEGIGASKFQLARFAEVAMAVSGRKDLGSGPGFDRCPEPEPLPQMRPRH